MADLCTLEDVKAYLGITKSDDDALLRRMIAAVSQQAEKHCDRAFAVTSYTDDIRLASQESVYLRRSPVVAITSVTIDGQALTTNEWRRVEQRLYPVLTSQALASIIWDGARQGWGSGQMTVVYTAGWASVPADVAQAVIETVAMRYKAKDNVELSNRSVNGESVTLVQAAFTAAAKAALAPYRMGPRL